MIFICNCGNIKSSQPWKLSSSHPWICPRCQDKKPEPEDKLKLFVKQHAGRMTERKT